MVTYWKKIWWSNAFWESSQSFFNMFSSNPWHKLHSPGIFIVSFNQNLKYKPHKNSRLLFRFAQRDYEVISSHIQSLLRRKICFRLGISLMNEWWTQPCEYSVNMQKSAQSEETGVDAFTLILEFTVFGSVHVSVFLRVKPSFQLLAHFRANEAHS